MRKASKASKRKKQNFADILRDVGSEIRPLDQLVSFSFKYLRSTEKFDWKGRESRYCEQVIERLTGLSSLKLSEFRNNRSEALRAHPIDWTEARVSESSFGIPNGDEYDEAAYQFVVSEHEHGRVHGFLIDTIFYVVWMDPEHALYQKVRPDGSAK
jgi:hypothetical protein